MSKDSKLYHWNTSNFNELGIFAEIDKFIESIAIDNKSGLIYLSSKNTIYTFDLKLKTLYNSTSLDTYTINHLVYNSDSLRTYFIT